MTFPFFTNLLCVGFGSFLGGVSRWLVSRALEGTASSMFPWGTFVVNIAGCLLIGLTYGALSRGAAMGTGLRLFLTIGFCGGFTTFSTFMNENFLMLELGDMARAALYTGVSLIAGLALLWLGYTLARG